MMNSPRTSELENINANLINLNSTNKYNNFERRTFNPIFTDSKYKNADAKVLGVFERRFRISNGGLIEIKHQTIAKELNCSVRTSYRSVKKLEKDGRLIVIRNWRNSYIFIPPGVEVKNIKSRIENIISNAFEPENDGNENTNKVTKRHNKSANMSPRHLYSKKRSSREQAEPPKKEPPGPPPKPPKKIPSKVSFSEIEKIESDYESHKEMLNDLSEKIIKMKPHRIKFSPKAAIKSHMLIATPINILLIALSGMAKPGAWKKTKYNGFSLLDLHIKWAKEKAGIELQNQNERDSIAEHEKRKRLDREFCKNGQFPFNDHGEIGDKIQWN